jgi:ATP-dependent Lon protease
MNVYEIPPPDHDGARRIAQAIYDEIRCAHNWGLRFPDVLGDAALDALMRASPREMRRAILNGFGAARIDGRDYVEAGDIRLDHGNRRKPIGF